jgi:hypothetical protein
MVEDISVSLRLGIMVMLSAALLGSVLTVAIPATQFLTDSSAKYTTLADYPYRTLQSMTGHELNGSRIYRMIEEAYSEVAIVAIREHPVTKPDDYKIVLCKVKTSDNTSGMQDEINSYGVTNNGFDDDSTGYSNIAVIFQHDNITNNFILQVNTQLSGGLEVICDVPDEYYE